MKAAVMYQKGSLPRYTDFPEPVTQSEDEVLLCVTAAAIKNIDKSRASGDHYSTTAEPHRATVIGGDGVGVLNDGQRVYAIGVSGMMAEKAIVDKRRMVALPDGLDDITAAALPNAVIGSAMALRFKASLKAGETVLINGATGFTGKMAVQLATHHGAGKIIATGRNEQSLQTLVALGADKIVSVMQDDESFVEQIKTIHRATPIDVVIDYLWGRSAELILSALKGNGRFTHRTRFVSVGAVTGDLIQLSAEVLRSVDLQLSGSGLGSWTKEQVQALFSEILPEAFHLAAAKKLRVDTVTMPLKDIEGLWDIAVADGKRLVVII